MNASCLCQPKYVQATGGKLFFGDIKMNSLTIDPLSDM